MSRSTAGVLGGAVLLLLVVGLLLPAGAQAHRGPSPSPAPAAGPHPYVTGPPDGTWPTYRAGPERAGFTASDGPSEYSWKWELNVSRYSGLFGPHLRTTPAIAGDLLIVADDLGDVFGLNASRNGSELWFAQVGVEPTAPTLAGGLVLLGDASGGVTALSLATGAHLWSRSFGAPIAQSVLVENGTGFVATAGGELAAFNATTGAALWSRSMGGSVPGAPAFDGSAVYVVNETGTLFSVDPATGAVRWAVALGAPVRNVGPVAADGRILVADFRGSLHAIAPNGTPLWTWSNAPYAGRGPFEAAPAADDRAAYVESDGGGIFAIDLANGSLLWNTTPAWPYTVGYNLTAPPVITPRALYLIDGLMSVDDIDPRTGAFRWNGPVGTTTYCSPAVVGDALVFGDDDGALFYIAPTHAATWPVTGTVRAANGTPLAGASLEVPSVAATSTGAGGNFTLELANGTYAVTVGAVGFVTATFPLTVAGPTGNLTYTLAPVTLYPVYGRVVDAGNDRGLSGVPVRLVGQSFYVVSTATTGPGGAFVIYGPNGSDYLTAAPPNGYLEVAIQIQVAGGPVYGAEISLPPAALVPQTPGWPGSLTSGWGLAALPLAAMGLGAAGLGTWAVSYHRLRRGLGAQVLSPFGRRIVRRLLLVPGQALLLLAVLFLFGSMLPAALQNPQSPCTVAKATSANACLFWTGTASCPWTSFSCVAASFLAGWWHLVVNIFTGQWGFDTFGKNAEPVTQMIAWWLPPSVELAVLALGISALLAYPIGLLAGWRPDGPFDTSVRLGSLLGLLLPSFLVILLVFLGIYKVFSSTFGDTPYGTLPGLPWYGSHGGSPPEWVGPGSNTEPTGFPLVDSALHGDWPFFGVVLVKSLLQAFLIAIVYVAIFLRYARHAVAERARSLPVVAARARGVPERTLLWRHAAREVLPVYVLIFGITLPIYLGTQALAEAFFNDTGILKIVISEMTSLQTTGFGISVGAQPQGNLYQVVIFLLLLLVLAGSIASDAIAHWLDPRLDQGER